MGVLSLAAQIDALTAVTGAGGDADAGVLKLFTNNPTITRNSVVGDFVEPTFTGYAEIPAQTWSAVFIDAEGRVAAEGLGGLFQRTGGAVDEVVNGWYITNTAETAFVYGEYFDTPLSFDQVGVGVNVNPKIRYGD